jgi:ammonium transporter, Amt family
VEGVSVSAQVGKQAWGVLITVLYSGAVTFVVLKAISLFMPLRATEDEESQGLDLALHNERGYIL